MPIPPNPFYMAVADHYPPAGWPMNPHAEYQPHQQAGKGVLSLSSFLRQRDGSST